MTSDPALFTFIARLRRAQPRNPDVLELCGQAERLALVISPQAADAVRRDITTDVISAASEARREAQKRATRK
jgi:hypothetical protein